MPVQDDDITELIELGASKVSGVGAPANGTPWLLLKGTGVAADPKSPHTDSPEADEQEDTMTKAEAEDIEAMLTKARFQGFCGTDDCGVCKTNFGPFYGLLVEKAKLSAADRRALPKSAFVFPDKAPGGSGSYPIHDENHAVNALSRASGKPEAAEVERKVHARYPKLGKSTGVPDFSTKVPLTNERPADYNIPSGQSKLAGPMTDGIRHDHTDPSFTRPGENSYNIPLEAGENTNIPPQATMDRPNEGEVVTHVSALKSGWTIEVTDVAKDNWISTDALGDDDEDDAAKAAAEATAAQSTKPGDGPWQAYDAATCDSVARGLAEAKIVLDQIRTREMTEAVSGNPSEWFDSYQLSCAMDDICSALGLVASLAYREAASGAEMDSASAKKSITSTQSLLTDIVGRQRVNPAGTGDRTSKEELTMATITQEDLDARIATKAAEAAQEAFVEMKAKDKKKKAKAKKAAAKAKARKNANNGGDIDASAIKPTSEHQANDINAVGGTSIRSEFKNKSKKGKGQGKAMKEALTLLQKMAGAPRPGGPVLDGQARGMFPAGEGRQSDVAKGLDADPEIVKLTERLEKSTDGMERDQISRELTLARLRKGHEAGLI